MPVAVAQANVFLAVQGVGGEQDAAQAQLPDQRLDRRDLVALGDLLMGQDERGLAGEGARHVRGRLVVQAVEAALERLAVERDHPRPRGRRPVGQRPGMLAEDGLQLGRVEVFTVDEHLDPDWRPFIAGVVRVTRRTWCRDTRAGLWRLRREVAYYAGQIPLDARACATAIRGHWGIENRNHHVRDRTLGEDASRIRRRPGIVARLRSFALNILRANGVTNVSEALYANALSLDRLLAHGLPRSQN